METSDWITLIWLGAGLALMAAEVLVPGLVVVFMGAAAVLVAGLRWIGLLDGLGASVGAWMILSVLLVVGLRSFLQRWLPSESRRDDRDEEADAMGTLVDVVRPCDDTSSRGRVRYQGTTWPAQTLSGTLPAGSRARLLYRDNLSWIVEPADEAAQAIEALERELLQGPEERG